MNNNIKLFSFKKKTILISILLFLCFSLFYFFIGRSFFSISVDLLEKNNHLFELDVARAISDMTSKNGDHYRTSVHPLFVLLVNPVGSTLANFIEPHQAARILNSAFGGLSVAVFFLFAAKYGLNFLQSFLATIVFGLSSSQLLLSAFPDVSSLATLSLLLMVFFFFTSIKQKKYNLLLWIFLGVFTFGITVTNFLQTFICFSTMLFAVQTDNKKRIRDLLLFGIGTIAVTTVFVLLQKQLFPSTHLFFEYNPLSSESKWYSLLVFSKPLTVIKELFRNFFIANVFTASPSLHSLGGFFTPYLSFQESWQFHWTGWLGILVWIAFLIYSITKLTKKREPFTFGIALCFLFNLLFHSIYGVTPTRIALFIYSGYFTYLLFILLLEGFKSLKGRKLFLAILPILILLVLNNGIQTRDILSDIKDHHLLETRNSYTAILTDPALKEYKNELRSLNHLPQKKLPQKRFFLFGMGNREKLIYRNGVLASFPSGEIIYSWDITDELINPAEYEVRLITVQDENIIIFEDSDGVWLVQEGSKLQLSEGKLNIPDFEGHPYEHTLRVLFHEILINIDQGRPLPNTLVYDTPWYRDAAMVSMVLDHTNNMDLIAKWILELDDPFDRNNGGVEEPDNLGQLLYMISLVSDDSHPLVPTILEEIERFEVDNYIVGETDSEEHPVYQTAWLKFGLNSLGLEALYQLPNIDDSYANLLWWYPADEPIPAPIPEFLDDYPYLGIATAHKRNEPGYAVIGSSLYPLSWEKAAGHATYSKMHAVDNRFRSERISVPHSWAATEMFFYLLDMN